MDEHLEQLAKNVIPILNTAQVKNTDYPGLCEHQATYHEMLRRLRDGPNVVVKVICSIGKSYLTLDHLMNIQEM